MSSLERSYNFMLLSSVRAPSIAGINRICLSQMTNQIHYVMKSLQGTNVYHLGSGSASRCQRWTHDGEFWGVLICAGIMIIPVFMLIVLIFLEYSSYSSYRSSIPTPLIPPHSQLTETLKCRPITLIVDHVGGDFWARHPASLRARIQKGEAVTGFKEFECVRAVSPCRLLKWSFTFTATSDSVSSSHCLFYVHYPLRTRRRDSDRESWPQTTMHTMLFCIIYSVR